MEAVSWKPELRKRPSFLSLLGGCEGLPEGGKEPEEKLRGSWWSQKGPDFISRKVAKRTVDTGDSLTGWLASSGNLCVLV